MNPLQAIRAKCLDCSAGQPSEVRECPVDRCALHPFRMGKNPHRKRRELSPEERQALAARLQAGRAISPELQGKTNERGEA